MKKGNIRGCVSRSILWYFGNLSFGCVPILFLGLVFFASRGKLGFDDMQRTIHEGALLFVCVATMGSVMLDLLQSEMKFSGRQIVHMVLAPMLAIGLLLLQYLFVMIKITSVDCFDITSGTSSFMLIFSLLYCISNKTKLLIREDFKYD